MNPMIIFQLKKAWGQFCENHPKFPLFISAMAKEGLKEGTIMAIEITTPEGRVYNSNLKLTQSDLEMIEMLKQLKP